MCYFILLTYSVVVHCKLCAKEQPMQCSDFLDIGSYQLLSLSHNVVWLLILCIGYLPNFSSMFNRI